MSEEKYIKVVPESIDSIKRLLDDMNIKHYDNRILDQLLNVSFSISQELIIKSNEYTRINSRFRIEESDAKVAISSYIDSNVINQNSFISNKIASNEINSVPLPVFPSKGVSKIWLPPEDDMHITPGWHIDASSLIADFNCNNNNRNDGDKSEGGIASDDANKNNCFETNSADNSYKNFNPT